VLGPDRQTVGLGRGHRRIDLLTDYKPRPDLVEKTGGAERGIDRERPVSLHAEQPESRVLGERLDLARRRTRVPIGHAVDHQVGPHHRGGFVDLGHSVEDHKTP
jgi:hypothetical protein